MKSLFLKYLPLVVLLLSHITVVADDQQPYTRQISLGIENNRLLFGQYVWNDRITARLNVSAYSEKLAYQYARATIGYKTNFDVIVLEGKYFFGTAFNGSYYNTGALVSIDAHFAKRLLIDAAIAPWFDSGYRYTTCWQTRVGCVLTEHINVKAGYTTVPEYRMSEKRLIGGFDFHVKQLNVSPYISVGTESENGGKNVRIIMEFEYQF